MPSAIMANCFLETILKCSSICRRKKYRRRVSEKTKSYVVSEHLGENFAFEHGFRSVCDLIRTQMRSFWRIVMSNSFWCSMCGINLYHLVKKSVGSVEYEGQKSIRKYIIHT
jgi:hypothetical protein